MADATLVSTDVGAAGDPEPVNSFVTPGMFKRLLRQPVVAMCMVFLALLVVVAALAPILMPDVAQQQAGNLLQQNAGPSSGHLLGTDSLGRDVFDRLLVGTRVALLGVAYAVLAALAIGIPLGLWGGYHGGRVDRAVGWLTDVMFSLPSLVVILVVIAVFPSSTLAAMLTFGVIVSPSMVRVVRSATIPVSKELYIDAARVAGQRDRTIIRKHVLPRIAGPIIVQASFVSGVALLVQIGLGFLGLLVPTPAPSWGGMIADGWQQIITNPWLILPPAIVTSLTVMALGLLGDGIRDATTAPWLPGQSGRARKTPSVERAAGEGAEPLTSGPERTTGRLLDVRGLTVTSGAGSIVSSATFSVSAGETVAIVGESGCGKTMTARSVLGLLPSGVRITAGVIALDGEDLTHLSPAAMRRRILGGRIGLVSQDPVVSLNPVFRVGWQVREVVRRHHPELSRAQAKAAAIDLLRQVELPEPELVYARYPHELSGGMAQRVSIARALAGNPDLLIADEPTTALDVTLQADILGLIRKLQAERGMAVLLITHDWGVVATVAERAVVMYAGEVIEQGALVDVFAEARHPYTAGLLASNPHHADKAKALPAIPGTVPTPGAWPVGCHFAARCRFANDACTRAAVPITHLRKDREVRCVRHDELRETG